MDRLNRRSMHILVSHALFLIVVLSALFASNPQSAHAVSTSIVISQIYGGGGNGGATFKNDFIELFNRSSSPVSIVGWSVQYASSGGTTWSKTALAGSIAPGQYYLVQEAAGTGGTVNLPTPDVSGNIPMAATGGKVALVNNNVTIVSGTSCPTGASIIDFIGYDGANCSETSPAATLGNSVAALRELNGCVDTDNNAADFAAGNPNPRNTLSAVTNCSLPPPPQVRIHDIQGASHISPRNGSSVYHVPGTVTALRSNGFYLQDPNPDGDAATSEGIFVFTSAAPAVSAGDAVNVNGLVTEFRPGGTGGLANLTTTEIGNPSLVKLSSGNALPTPVIIGTGGRVPPAMVIEDDATGDVETSGVFDPANDGVDFYESLEGMLVQVNDAVAVGPWHDFGSNREIPVVGDNGANAGLRTNRGGIIIRANDFNPERIILNDLIAGGPTLPSVNVADRFPGAIVGVMDYSFGNYKLEVAQLPAVVSGGLAQEVTTLASTAQLAAGTFNVENLAPGDPAGKFSALAALIVNNLKSPDVLAIEEIQDNNGAPPTGLDNGVVDASQTWSMLIAAIQTAGGPTYQYRQIDPVDDQDGGAPGGNIRQGFLFRTDRGLSFIDRPGAGSLTANSVIGSGPGTQLQYSPGRIDPANPAFNSSRKPLAGEFMFHGHHLFVIANHFNSKSGDEPLFGRFQPPVLSSEVQRVQQAQIVHDFVKNIETADPKADVVVLGDLNDFEFSNPVNILKSGVLNDLMETLPPAERYSYVFDGNSQTLDHILLSGYLSGTYPIDYDVVHVNSEFATQASDHEPQVVRIGLNEPLICTSARPSIQTLWPADHAFVSVNVLGVTNPEGDSASIVISAIRQDEPVIGLGAGDTAPDGAGVGTSTAHVRAERAGTGNGRVYHIAFTASDGYGRSCTGEVKVGVPHDQKGNAIDDGSLFDSTVSLP